MNTNNTKQTAGNNATLRKIKILMNTKIFAAASIVMNKGGEAATAEYMKWADEIKRELEASDKRAADFQRGLDTGAIPRVKASR